MNLITVHSLKSLYEVTGNVTDINTKLVPLSKLIALIHERDSLKAKLLTLPVKDATGEH